MSKNNNKKWTIISLLFSVNSYIASNEEQKKQIKLLNMINRVILFYLKKNEPN